MSAPLYAPALVGVRLLAVLFALVFYWRLRPSVSRFLSRVGDSGFMGGLLRVDYRARFTAYWVLAFVILAASFNSFVFVVGSSYAWLEELVFCRGGGFAHHHGNYWIECYNYPHYYVWEKVK